MKRILLAGAGHAHLVVLRKLAEMPLLGARITLVSTHRNQIYSGMLPGFVAGHYSLEEIQVDVAALAERAHAEFVQGSVETLDLGGRRARLHDGSDLQYEHLSLNLGSLVDTSIPGSEHALPVKPFEKLMEGINAIKPVRIAIAGAGAGGIELAMALRHRGAGVALYSQAPSVSPALAKRAVRQLRRCGVDFRPGMAIDAIEAGPAVIAGSTHQAFDLVLRATGASPAPLIKASGLACDERGFALVDPTLRSVSHPEVFAAGDCATLRDASHPKSGVYSVRHGEALAGNLARLVSEEPLMGYVPQARFLALLSCGRKYAIAERGGWSTEGAWTWRWKDWIDRRWIRSLAG